MLIAVDGPLASGKGTIARALAVHFNLPHMDTGTLYRAVAVEMLEAGEDPRDAGRAAERARARSGCDQRAQDPQRRRRHGRFSGLRAS